MKGEYTSWYVTERASRNPVGTVKMPNKRVCMRKALHGYVRITVSNEVRRVIMYSMVSNCSLNSNPCIGWW
jgi:hypothetical protein